MRHLPTFLSAFLCASAFALPAPVFHAAFDGSPVGRDFKIPSCSTAPLTAHGLAYAPGVSGQAARLSAAAKSRLEYPLSVLPDQRRGTVALWYKPEWEDGTDDRWRHLFGFTAPWNRQRLGMGAVFVWHYGPVLRGDTCDAADSFVTTLPRRGNGEWRHVAFTWNGTRSALYLDGKPAGNRPDNDNPLATALKEPSPSASSAPPREKTFISFHVGCSKDGRQADGLIDEFKLFAEPLTEEQIAALAAEHANPSGTPKKINWSEWLSSAMPQACPHPAEAGTTNPERAHRSLYRLQPGCAMPTPANLDLRLVETLTLDREPPPDRFASTGDHTFGTLGAVRYLEAGTNANDRFALRFRLPDAGPLYCFEWDFPDDKARTADIVVQPSAGPRNNYELQVGYMTGGEYPNQNTMLTARCLYWMPGITGDSPVDISVVFMTARANAPAAVARIRLYKVEGELPRAVGRDFKIPSYRTLALYYEDPAIGYDFASPGADPAAFITTIDRTAAYMKYTGQNLLCYPGVWYHGRIGDGYNPRGHAEDFLTAWYVRFDAEGLGVMPTFNQQTLPLPDGMKITKRSLSDGSLHPTCVSIWNTGMPNPGGWHGTPPNFNILHPHTQETVMRDVDALIAQGAAHPSFKGLDLRLAEHCFHWLGSIRAGYNDYMIDAFTADTGIRVPVDRADLLRGKLYADWLLANAREEWVAWRCRAVAAWHKRIAARLAQARPDLRLSLTLLTPMHPTRDRWPATSGRGNVFDDPRYIDRLNREAGVDARLYADAPNIVIAQGLRPARFRAGYDRPKTAEERAFLRDVFTTRAYYDSLSSANLPWLHLHDHYWESAIGKSKPLQAAWLKEEPWRVTTLNPAGFYAMRPYVLPFRYHDILGITRGGFLVGTYGMEEYLIPFAKAFRALPAERFADAPGSTETVKVRELARGDKKWFYAVNTGDAPATLTLATGSDMTDLVTDASPPELSGENLTLTLAPYQLRSFVCVRSPAVTDGGTVDESRRSR